MTFAPEYLNGSALAESDEAYGDEAYEEAYGDEAYGDEAYGDEAYEERSRQRNRPVQRPVRTAPVRPSTFTPPAPAPTAAGAQGGTVTPALLETRLATLRAELDNRIRATSRAVSQVDGKVRSVDASQGRLSRRVGRDLRQVRQQNAQTRDSIMLLQLLNRPSTRTITENTSGLLAKDKVVLDSDGFSSILPLLLLSGLGGSSGTEGGGQGASGGLFGGDSGGMGLIALLLLAQR
ncbi:hypothetical protein [Streptomyces sp. NPDC093568]|uniref:hypothetical protein n=1 Tax=Streptomyces sp. NPDC093568 TaxID=3366041 RepID=UPI0038168DE2